MSPRIDALLRGRVRRRSDRHRLGRRGARAREPPHKRETPFNVLLRDDKTIRPAPDATERAPRLLGPPVARDGNVYDGPFMPASSRGGRDAGASAVGIRSCNRSLTDGATVRVSIRHQAMSGAVRSRFATIERYRHAVESAQLLIEGRQDELVTGSRRHAGSGRA